MVGCSSLDVEPSDADIAETREALVLGFNPLVSEFEVVASLDPAVLDSPENLVVVEQGEDTYIYVSSLLNGQILRVDVQTSEVLRIPTPATPGSFVAGIDVTENDDIVFVVAFFGEYGPDHGSIYLLNTDDNTITELATIPYAGPNGLAIWKDHWYAVDAFNPTGIIWRGSLAGGPAEVWYQGEAVAPDASYLPTPCNPPMPLGGNGLRLRKGYSFLGLHHPPAFVVSNTTMQSISEIEILPDGSAGAVNEMFSDLIYPDDIWPSRYCRDAFLATHGFHRVYYINPVGVLTELSDGTVCDGPTAVVVHGEYAYVSCGGDVLICRPDAFGDPDPNAQGYPGQPAIVRARLDSLYTRICRP